MKSKSPELLLEEYIVLNNLEKKLKETYILLFFNNYLWIF